MPREPEERDEQVTLTVSGSTLLAVSMLLSSIILATGFVIGTQNIGTGLASITVAAAPASSSPAQAPPSGQGSAARRPPAPQQGGGSGTARLAELLSEQDYAKGDPNAPVTIIEYSDFQCPFCRRFFQNTLAQLEENYVKTGKVRFVYKHFPLESIHPEARAAALAAECAGEQGRFWEFHDKIFENQEALGEDSYKAWAADLGLDEDAFAACLKEKRYNDKVDADFAQGRRVGVTGTPSFLIGPSDGQGTLLVGAQPFSAFQGVLDNLLR